MSATVFLYGLRCPLSSELRYVGKAKNPKARLSAHITQARTKFARKDNWLRSLERDGLRPILEILDEVPVETWQVHERGLIARLRQEGVPLLNVKDGGDGPDNLPRSDSHAAAISAALTGRKHSAERRAASAAHLARIRQPYDSERGERAREGQRKWRQAGFERQRSAIREQLDDSVHARLCELVAAGEIRECRRVNVESDLSDFLAGGEIPRHRHNRLMRDLISLCGLTVPTLHRHGSYRAPEYRGSARRESYQRSRDGVPAPRGGYRTQTAQV
jgi:hypothetical protein